MSKIDMKKTIQGFYVESILNLLCGAWEGGSNYWIESVDYKQFDLTTNKKDDPYFPKYQLAPFRDGEELTIHVRDGLATEKPVLNLDKIKQGVALMREEHNRHYRD